MPYRPCVGVRDVDKNFNLDRSSQIMRDRALILFHMLLFKPTYVVLLFIRLVL